MYINKLDDGTVELTAPVMIPGARDCDYENGEKPLTTTEINQFAKDYETYRFVDDEHGLTRDGRKIGTPTNSFLLKQDTTMNTVEGSKTYPTGTWMMTSHLTDEAAIKKALNGEYSGYSVSVFNRERADAYLEALKHDHDTPMPTACKTINSGGTALIKDINDPVVLSVSLVKSPCLHDSKFCELDGDIMTDEVQSFKSKILKAMDLTEVAEVEALKSEVVSLESKIDEMQNSFETALKSMQESFEAKLAEALTPVAEKSEVEIEEVTPEDEEQTTEKEAEVVEEEVEEEEVEEVAEKGESKAEPIHDNLQAEKTKSKSIYEIMGRNPDGTRRK